MQWGVSVRCAVCGLVVQIVQITVHATVGHAPAHHTSHARIVRHVVVVAHAHTAVLERMGEECSALRGLDVLHQRLSRPRTRSARLSMNAGRVFLEFTSRMIRVPHFF